jgi:hypothetical protein
LGFIQEDSLDIRSQKTYLALDSIAIKEKLQAEFVSAEKIINGFYLGFF